MNGHSSETQRRLVASLAGLEWRRTEVRLLLGTDAFIPHERRVALVPRHLEELRRDLESLGLELSVTVVEGAGDRIDPPLSDESYRQVGAELVSADAAGQLPAFDVVHALKEPTDYEAQLAGPFLRLGALHLASKPSGVCLLARQRPFAAILDGATVGNCAYLLEENDRTPIVASMSRFAGAVAGQKAVEGVQRRGLEPGTVVVVGGGIAGRAAIRQVGAITRRLVVVEPWEPMRRLLAEFLPGAGFTDYEVVEGLEDEMLDDAIGIVFAHRSGARAAEKVCRLEQIHRMRRGAAIADIAIDQGGSIAHDGYDEEDDAAAARAKYIDLLGDDYSYYAEVNMPREEPGAASETHGDASVPYVTCLLALCAHLGGPQEVVEHLLTRQVEVFQRAEDIDFDFLDAVLQDLRNGTQIVVRDGRVEITDPEVARNENLRDWLTGCAAP